MKLLICLAALLALGQAKSFVIKDKDNKTCIMVEVAGMFQYKEGINKTVDLNLTDAEFMKENSTCETLKLSFNNETAQVWFDFSTSTDDNQEISLVTAFVPSNLFGDKPSNETVRFDAEKAFSSPKNNSYSCKSEVTTKLTTTKDLNITVSAVLKDFQAQSHAIEGDKFSNATECPQDITPTPTPMPTPTPKPTPKPKENVYSHKEGNITCIKLTGNISFAIKYETKKTMKTTTVSIPKSFNVTGSCKYDNTSSKQMLSISFFNDTWATDLLFEMSGSTYDVSMINLTYMYDQHFPDAQLEGDIAFVSHSPDKFLKSKKNGYYTCNSKLTEDLSNNVTLNTRNLKFLAFNDKKDANFTSSNVSECSQDEDSSSVVPIAVGAALAGLVIIVLIAYLIGRRRSKKTGYESV